MERLLLRCNKRGIIELAEKAGFEEIGITHLSNDVNQKLAKAESIARWFDEKGNTSSLKKIIFTGCGVGPDYMDDFIRLNADQGAHIPLNSNMTGNVWKCRI